MNHDPHEVVSPAHASAKDASDEEFLVYLNAALERATMPAPRGANAAGDWPLVYVVGLPRSGTTLLAQLVARYLPIGYITNLAARFWRRPSAGIRLAQIVLGDRARERIVFQSTHGVTPQAEGPHEFGYFWRHWFELDRCPTHHLTQQELARLDTGGLTRALESEILAPSVGPVMLRNVICGFQAAFLSGLHPRSVFVYCEREPAATVASILEARRARQGSYAGWWSLKPSTYPFTPAAADPVEEVVRQVRDCRREMLRELRRPGVHAVFTHYDELCSAPAEVLRKVCSAVQEQGVTLVPLCTDIPALKASRGPTLPEAMLSRLRDCLNRAAEEEPPTPPK